MSAPIGSLKLPFRYSLNIVPNVLVIFPNNSTRYTRSTGIWVKNGQSSPLISVWLRMGQGHNGSEIVSSYMLQFWLFLDDEVLSHPASIFSILWLNPSYLSCCLLTYGSNSPPLSSDEVQPLLSSVPLKCWFSHLPIMPLQSFLQAAPALNRQSLQTSSNLYTPVSGHGRCISNCQCALPDALLSFDPIHSSGCVQVAVIYTPCDFTDV